MTIFEDKVIDSLVKDNVLNQEQKKQIAQETQKNNASVEDVLLKVINVPEDSILKSKAEIAQVGAYSLKNVKIPKETLNFIPVESVQQYKMIPILQQNEKLIVGMVDPTDIKAKEALRFIFF